MDAQSRKPTLDSVCNHITAVRSEKQNGMIPVDVVECHIQPEDKCSNFSVKYREISKDYTSCEKLAKYPEKKRFVCAKNKLALSNTVFSEIEPAVPCVVSHLTPKMVFNHKSHGLTFSQPNNKFNSSRPTTFKH